MYKKEVIKRDIFIFILILTLVILLFIRQAKSSEIIVIDAGHGGDPNTFYYYNASVYIKNQYNLEIINQSNSNQIYYIEKGKDVKDKSNWIHKGDIGTNITIDGKIIYEKDINLGISGNINILLNPFYNTIMTRDKDNYIFLEKRREISEKNNASLFISIHQNSMEKNCTGKNRAEVYYNKNNLRELSESIIKDLNKSFKFIDGKAMQTEKFTVLNTSQNAILIEVNFLCNPEMARFLENKSNQEKISKSIYLSIRKWKQK